MKQYIAVPLEKGEVFQHFGHTKTFRIYEADCGGTLSWKDVDAEGQGHGLLADFLAVQGVSTVLCGGIGQGAKDALAAKGIALFGGVSGEVDLRVNEYLQGVLVFNPDIACTHKH